MSTEKRFLRNGLIAVAAAALVQYFVPGGWTSIGARARQTMAEGVEWAATSINVPSWLLVTLAALTAISIIAAAFAVSRQRRKPLPSGINSPATAEIYGIRWHWNNCDGNIRDIVAACPKCDLPVTPKAETRHGFIRLLSYQCSCHRWRSQSFQCSQETFIDRVCRTIQKQMQKTTV